MGIKGRPKHYPYEIIEYDTGAGKVKYAQWMHPSESKKIVSVELIDGYRKYIQEGDFCLDIGAHSGDTALPMAIAAGKSGCVLALEPNPYVYPVLEKTSRANSHLVNIKTIMAAAGTEEGFMEFEYSDSGFCNGGRHDGISMLNHGHAFKLKVFAVNLERELRSDFSIFLPRLRFIKVDAEGYDLHVLKSIEGIIREYSPVIKTEVFKQTGRKYREEMLAFFKKHGYSARRIIGEPLVEGDSYTHDNLDVGKHFDILARHRNQILNPPVA